MTIKDLAQQYKSYAIALRREFHMYPEASMKEYETQKRILRELSSMGIEGTSLAGTGVVAYIEGDASGKTIGLRADMDALELKEENSHAYVSKTDGLMHACGHDGHVASLLLAAKILKEQKIIIKGRVKLIFQPGEETASGAKAMIEAGVMKDVDAIFGIHLWNDCESGKISAEQGPRMASAGIFKIFVEGKGGHGSMPHQGVDAGLVGAAILQNLQTIVSREINPLDPAVVSVGIFNSGTRFNVLPADAYLEGTTRCFNLEVNDSFESRITRVAIETAKSYRATAKVDYQQLVLPTINDPAISEIVKRSAVDVEGKESLILFEKTTGGEDFSYYGQLAPSAFAFVGCRKTNQEEYYPHHHPKFDIDEEALAVSGALYAQVAINYLEEGSHD